MKDVNKLIRQGKKEEGRTGHDGVFADRFTQLVGEVFCGHIFQEGKGR